jgi:hypothetical protein
MMSALISFVRELAAELNRGADAIEAEAGGLKTTDPVEERVILIALASASTMRHVGKAIERAAKKALCT